MTIGRWVAPFSCGLLMAFGLGLGGMLEPQRIIGFLDVTGSFDPTLLFVMVGGLSTYSVLYAVVMRMKRPLMDSKFHIPEAGTIDKKLVIGATLFGVGWGISGMCPGPGIVTAASLDAYALLFVAAMIVGIVVAKRGLE